MPLIDINDIGKVDDYLLKLKTEVHTLTQRMIKKKEQLKNVKEFLEDYRSLEEALFESKNKLFLLLRDQVELRKIIGFDSYKKTLEAEIENLKGGTSKA